jgi:hypothetical protein
VILVSIKICEGALTYRVRATASSIESALEIVGEGKAAGCASSSP